MYRLENAANRNNVGRKKSSRKAASQNPDEIGYGKAADWWSVGVMIYEMLSGKPAFRGGDLRQTYQNVLFAEVLHHLLLQPLLSLMIFVNFLYNLI